MVQVMAFVILLGMVGIERAFALRRVGVSPGDWAEYICLWSGNGTLPEPQYRTDWMKFIVKEVSGLNVTYEQLSRMADGSETNYTNVENVETGEYCGSSVIIAADLNQGDLIYTNPPAYSYFEGATINETTYRNILGEIAEVNIMNLTVTTSSPSINHTVSYEFWWFRSTGCIAAATIYVLTQIAGNMTLANENSTTTWMKMEVVIYSIIPEFPSFLILPLFMIATLLAVIVHRRKRAM